MELECAEKDCQQAFRNADEEGKGYLTQSDYKVAVLELCGYKPSSYEISAVWSKLNPAPAGQSDVTSGSRDRVTGLDQSAFVSMMVERLTQKDKDELIRQIFIAFDASLRGFITVADCVQAFKEVAPHISEKLTERWFSEVDSDYDGRVTFRDFEMMMKSFILINPAHPVGHTHSTN